MKYNVGAREQNYYSDFFQKKEFGETIYSDLNPCLIYFKMRFLSKHINWKVTF